MTTPQNHTVIVTGAAGAIGSAISAGCLAAGHRVIAVDRDGEALSRLQKSLGPELFCYQADVCVEEDISALFCTLKREEITPSALVNNAGIYLAKTLAQYSPDEMMRVFKTNVIAPAVMIHHFSISLPAGARGSVVNIASVAALHGSLDPIYGASKAALIGLTKSCAVSLVASITVNAIALGVVDGGVSSKIPAGRMKNYREIELLKDSLEPKDVADTIVFLIGPSATHYTGAVFDLNNGCYLR
jgi:3-oxoacyl-[acyl-carrier protein] reductase